MKKTKSFASDVAWLASLLGLFLTGAGTSVAEVLEKDGKPCVKEICLGDGLPELQKLNWEVAREFPKGFKSEGSPIANRKPDAGTLTAILQNFKGPAATIRAASAYLPADYRSGHFDATTLPQLAQIQASCFPYILNGRYTPQGGMPTVVSIALFPSADGATQSWKVFQIERHFPTNLTQAQVDQVNAQVKASYGKWSSDRQGGRQEVWVKNAEVAFFTPNVWFGLSTSAFGNLNYLKEKTMLHPLCGGRQQLKIN